MKKQVSAFAVNLEKFRNYMYFDVLGGPQLIPMRYVINFFKGMTAFWIIFLMYYFNNFSQPMYVYLFLHGTYGMAWLIKDLIFPDASFMGKSTFGAMILLATVLTLYWCIPLSIAAGYGLQQITQFRKYLVISIYLIGLVLMMGSDYQKTTTLAKRKGLISSGFFARTRNPNYLGQIMIYGSFAICSGYWTSYAIIFSIWTVLFTINMYLKDEMSYKHKEGWEVYKNNSYMLLPKLLPTNILNYAFYATVTAAVYVHYHKDTLLA